MEYVNKVNVIVVVNTLVIIANILHVILLAFMDIVMLQMFAIVQEQVNLKYLLNVSSLSYSYSEYVGLQCGTCKNRTIH